MANSILLDESWKEVLKEEFEISMILMGTATVKEINKEYIFQD